MAEIQTANPPTFESVWAALQETDRIVKDNARQIGKLGKRKGEVIEYMVAPNLGFFVIEPSGETFNIIPPEGQPKEW